VAVDVVVAADAAAVAVEAEASRSLSNLTATKACSLLVERRMCL
jgi:hypothetical protein